MAQKKASQSKETKKSATRGGGGKIQKSRPKPTGVMKSQVVMHSKTLSNGQPRPKKRS